MLIRRSVEHKVNMGNYEHVIVSASVETEVSSLADEAAIQAALDKTVEADLQKARFNTACTDSYIHSWEI